jgi:hypothetical protein
MPKFSRLFLFSFFLCCFFNNVSAQVNAVTFGKNRVQFKKLKWNYYQTDNFNVYFYSNGQELAKYVLQVAEKELSDIEKVEHEDGSILKEKMVKLDSFESFVRTKLIPLII